MSIFKKAIFLSPLFLLISCGSKTIYVTEVLPTSTTIKVNIPATTQPVYDDYSTTRQNFLDSVRELNPYATTGISDYELVEYANTVCDGLQSGMTAMDIAAIVESPSDNDPEIRQFLSSVTAGAITFFCPDQLYKFEGY